MVVHLVLETQHRLQVLTGHMPGTNAQISSSDNDDENIVEGDSQLIEVSSSHNINHYTSSNSIGYWNRNKHVYVLDCNCVFQL